MAQTWAVGDPHGHLDPLLELLGRTEVDLDQDHLWIVGDLVNRGPDSLGTLRWARAAHERMGARFQVVLGNHDLHLLACALGVTRPRPKDRFEAVLEAPDREPLVEWLRSRPLLVRSGERLLVHAGLDPRWSVDEAEQRARALESLLTSGDAPKLLAAWRGRRALAGGPSRDLWWLTMVRCCDERGEPVSHKGPPGEAPPGCRPWFEMPRRRSSEAFVVCGHWAALGLHVDDHVASLDTGAAWGGSLTALRLDDGHRLHVDVAE